MTLLFQAGGVFPDILQNMQNMGFFLYLFPFLLALAIFYGILHWALGDRIPKSGVGLISIILAFFVMLYTSWNTGIVSFFANLGGAGLIVGSGILFAAILLGLMGFKISDLTSDASGKKLKWVFILGVLLIAVLIFFGAGGAYFGLVPSWSNQGEFWTVVFFVVIVGLAVWWLGEGNGGAAPAGGEKKE
jgi:hypothetical protein